LPTLQRRQLVGHDILLARHGNHICTMRLDRPSNRVVALLDDGSIDSAPNLIDPNLQLPETFGTVLRDNGKLLACVSAGFAALLGGAFAAMNSLAASMEPAQFLELVAAYSGT